MEALSRNNMWTVLTVDTVIEEGITTMGMSVLEGEDAHKVY